MDGRRRSTRLSPSQLARQATDAQPQPIHDPKEPEEQKHVSLDLPRRNDANDDDDKKDDSIMSFIHPSCSDDNGSDDNLEQDDNDNRNDNYEDEGDESVVSAPPHMPLLLVDFEKLCGYKPSSQDEVKSLVSQVSEALLGSSRSRGDGSHHTGGTANDDDDGKENVEEELEATLNFNRQSADLFDVGIASHFDTCMLSQQHTHNRHSQDDENNDDHISKVDGDDLTVQNALAFQNCAVVPYPEFLPVPSSSAHDRHGQQITTGEQPSSSQTTLQSTKTIWKRILEHTYHNEHNRYRTQPPSKAKTKSTSYNSSSLSSPPPPPVVQRILSHNSNCSRDILWKYQMSNELLSLSRSEQHRITQLRQTKELFQWRHVIRPQKLSKLYQVRETLEFQYHAATERYDDMQRKKEERVEMELRRRKERGLGCGGVAGLDWDGSFASFAFCDWEDEKDDDEEEEERRRKRMLLDQRRTGGGDGYRDDDDDDDDLDENYDCAFAEDEHDDDDDDSEDDGYDGGGGGGSSSSSSCTFRTREVGNGEGAGDESNVDPNEISKTAATAASILPTTTTAQRMLERKKRRETTTLSSHNNIQNTRSKKSFSSFSTTASKRLRKKLSSQRERKKIQEARNKLKAAKDEERLVREMCTTAQEKKARLALDNLKKRLDGVDDLLESLQEEEWKDEEEGVLDERYREKEEGGEIHDLDLDDCGHDKIDIGKVENEGGAAEGEMTLLDQILAMVLGTLPPTYRLEHCNRGSDFGGNDDASSPRSVEEHFRYIKKEHEEIVRDWKEEFGRLPISFSGGSDSCGADAGAGTKQNGLSREHNDIHRTRGSSQVTHHQDDRNWEEIYDDDDDDDESDNEVVIDQIKPLTKIPLDKLESNGMSSKQTSSPDADFLSLSKETMRSSLEILQNDVSEHWDDFDNDGGGGGGNDWNDLFPGVFAAAPPPSSKESLLDEKLKALSLAPTSDQQSSPQSRSDKNVSKSSIQPAAKVGLRPGGKIR